MRSLLLLVGVVGCAIGVQGAKPEMVAKVVAGELKEARASWWGFNQDGESTAALQAAIDSRVPRLIVDKQAGPWITDKLRAVSDQEIFFEPGTEVLAKKGAFTGKTDSLITLSGVTNVILRGPGATLRMRRADYDAAPYVKAEWRHVISLRSSARVQIIGLTLAESGGDGIYLGSLRPVWPNQDIVIRDVVCDRNYRQGISVISAENLLIENTIMRDTAGTPPAAGIDFEPNHATERLKNCVMRNCVTENNQGDGYEFYLPNLNAGSEPLSIRLENCRSIGDRIGFRLITGNSEEGAVGGTMVVSNCSFEGSKSHGMVIGRKPPHGASLTFDKCVLSGSAAHTNGIEDIVFNTRSEDDSPVGGVVFNEFVLDQPVERPWCVYHGGAEYEPVSGLHGLVRLRKQGRGEQVVELTPEWVNSTFPPRFTVRVPRVTKPLESARVVDKASGLQRLAPLRMRSRGTLTFYAKQGDEVVMSGVQSRVGRGVPSTRPLLVSDPAGKRVKSQPLPDSFGERVELRFVPQSSGFYTVSFDVGGNAFMWQEANVVVGVDTTAKGVAVIGSQGSLYAAVPRGTELFAFGITGEGRAELVGASVFNPAGEEMWSKDLISLPERYTATKGEGRDGGLWEIRVRRPSSGVFEDFHVQAVGIPAYLFLHRERYWEF